jgi:hypothetical protein
MSELEIDARDDAATNDVPGQVTELGKISELIARDSPTAPKPTDDDGADDTPAAPDPDPVEIPEDNPEPDAADADDAPVKVDYDQVIPMPEGAEPVTIGQLKDYYQGKVDFDQQRETWEANRVELDGKHIIAKQGLMDLANLVGQVNPQVLAHLQQQQQATRQTEAAALLEVFPEWADAEVKRAATPKLKAVAAQLGFSEAEFAHIADHRQIRALHMLEGFLTKQAAAAAAKDKIAVELPKAQKTQKRKVSDAQRKAQILERAKGGDANQKNAAISTLIRG